ncbi:MAG: hypothetical protein HON53_09405 [Planctomycetaceae bacterium]|jgi:hypothetical protein|nr:hypothetical protein [Planctomycetaceae bacterium]MBT6155066.1 hypothetical protein [Planctomycetaceae bacterium]MBT6496151.1 hypothetical protein [Planctomycetaceae bacterium]
MKDGQVAGIVSAVGPYATRLDDSEILICLNGHPPIIIISYTALPTQVRDQVSVRASEIDEPLHSADSKSIKHRHHHRIAGYLPFPGQLPFQHIAMRMS